MKVGSDSSYAIFSFVLKVPCLLKETKTGMVLPHCSALCQCKEGYFISLQRDLQCNNVSEHRPCERLNRKDCIFFFPLSHCLSFILKK